MEVNGEANNNPVSMESIIANSSVEVDFFNDLKTIIDSARNYAFNTANLMQVVSNWLLGWRIVEQEQNGKTRAEYGKHILELASKELTYTFGKGYSVAALKNFRKFYSPF